MSKDSRNIEDLFRSNFENYKVEPSFDAWDKIDSKLSGYGFNNYFKRIFNSYKVNPSEKLWPRIARKVWIANFVKFQPFTFNIYNVGIISSIVILVTVGLNNKITNQGNVLENPIIAENVTTSPNNYSSSFITEVNTSFNEDKKYNRSRKKIGFSAYLKNAIEKKTLIDKEDDILITPNPVQTINSRYIVESQLERDNSLLNINAKKDNTKSKIVLENTTHVSTKRNSTADTVGVNAYGKPIVMERQKWSYDVYTALVNSQSVFKTNNKEFEKIIKDYESKQSPLLSYSVGLNVNYEYYGFVLQGGLSYSQLGHSGSRLLLNDSTFNSGNYMSYVADSSHNAYFNYDSLSYNDTLSSILLAYDKFDTLSIYGNDSLLNNKLNSKNKYRYFEFPLTVSYSVKQNNFTFGVTGGLITGLFINVSEGPKINSEKKTSDLKKENPYAVPNFSSYLGFYVGYELNNNSAIFLEPYYRKSLNSIYTKESYFTQKFTAYGARVGLRYSF